MERGVFSSTLLSSEIIAGPGSRDRLVPWLRARGLERPLLVCGPSVARTAFLEALLQDLRSAFPRTRAITDMPAPPTAQAVEAVVAGWGDEPWDAVIGVGGGSSLDAAKAVEILVSRGGTVREHAIWRGASRAIGAREAARRDSIVVVVPTTCSGSEANGSASIRDRDSGERFSLMDPGALPSLVVLDPQGLSDHGRPYLCATAFNALAHCLEGIYSRGHNPLADSLAVATARTLCDLLEHPDGMMEEGALLRLQVSSVLAGSLIREVYVGLHHAVCHSLVSVCGTSHAGANAAMLPWAVGYNAAELRAAGAEDRLALLAEAVPASPGEDGRLQDRIASLQAGAGLPRRLRDLGIEPEDIPAVVDATLTDRALDTNPVGVGVAELRALLETAW